MTNRSKQTGLSLLITLVLGLSVSFIGIGVALNKSQNQSIKSNTHAMAQQAANTIAINLLQFATTQGFNSLSDIGHMPCPSLTANGVAQVSCLNSNVGYLPNATHVAINYINHTVPHYQALQYQQMNWQYAVSKQVLQPNALNWSKKVDWSKPPLTVNTPIATYNDVVAVVAASLSKNAETLTAQPPLRIIRQQEVRQHIDKALVTQTQLILNKLPPSSINESTKPQIKIVAQKSIANNADCQCRCTKTRCNCYCLEPAIWVSKSDCFSASPFCQTATNWLKTETTPWIKAALEALPGNVSVCQSKSDELCKFKGATQLLNGWPVSQYQPGPTVNRSCRPTSAQLCPTSTKNTACECQFNWPTGLLPELENLKLTKTNTSWTADFAEK